MSWGTSLPLTGLLFERGSDKNVSPKRGGALGAVKKKEMARVIILGRPKELTSEQ